jgi:tetratricopeptide (TPR) repeat protein
MRQKNTIFFISLLALTILLSSTGDVLAQKKKKSKKASQTIVATQPVGQDAKWKAEMYHTEAEKYFLIDDYAKAFVLYQKALETDPANATANFRIAQIYEKGNEPEKAILYLQKAISLDETNKFFYLELANVYTSQSNFKDAAVTYETMLRKCKKTDEYLFELAAVYIYLEDYTQALKTYDVIEEKFGINEQVIAQKQKLYLKQSNLEMAISEGQKLIDAYPNEPRYTLMLAEIYISNNQPEKAIPYLDAVVTKDPGNPRALLMLADLYRKRGEVEKSNIFLNKAFAQPDLDIQPKIQVLASYIQQLPNADIEGLCVDLVAKVITAHPEDARSYEISGDFYMRISNDSLAMSSYKKAIELGSKNYNTWQSALQLELKLENTDQAVITGEKALELFPNQSGICWFLGTAYLMKKDYESASAILEQGKKLSGNNKELQSYFNAQLGDTYNNLKQYSKSDESYEAALAFDPENDHVLNNYSYFLSLRKEKLDLAKKMSTKLVLKNPDNATYLDTHAWVLYVRGELEEAKTYIEKAIAGPDISGTVIEHYGDILFKLGNVDLAVKQWQIAKGMDETSELIDKKIADRKLYE